MSGRLLQATGRIVACIAMFTLAAIIGWGIVCLAYRGLDGVAEKPLEMWGGWLVVSIPVTAVFGIATRKRVLIGRPLAYTLAGWGLLAAVFTLLIALVPPRPRLGFLGDQPLLFSAKPGALGFILDVYTYEANLNDVVAAAKAELVARGFKVANNPDRTSAEFWKPATSGLAPWSVSVTVDRGRTTGKYWDTDGDVLVTNDDEKWVTVSVIFVDPWPYVRGLAP